VSGLLNEVKDLAGEGVVGKGEGFGVGGLRKGKKKKI